MGLPSVAGRFEAGSLIQQSSTSAMYSDLSNVSAFYETQKY